MSEFSRRHLLTGAVATTAIVATQAGLPAQAAQAAPSRAAAVAPASGVRTATRYAPFPVGYSTGSFTVFESQANIAKTLDLIVSSGGTMVRFDIMWVLIQPKQTVFDWTQFDYMVAQARARNLGIVGILVSCPPWAALGGGGNGTTRPASAATFATFAKTVAARYKGKIAAYEIWNEPNSRTFFAPDPDPTFYGQLVKAAYPAIKAADPSVPVLAGALGPAPDGDGTMNPITFVTKMYAAGAGGYFDAFSFHPYDYSQTLAAATLWDNTAARRMIEIHAIMKANGDGAKKIWITEYGAPTGPSLSQATQASLISYAMQSWGEASYAGPFLVFTVVDNSSETFGVVTSTFVAKKALATIKNLQAAGLPPTGRGTAFKTHADAALGASVSVTYLMGGGAVQECENGSRYQTANGWFSSPPAVATLARLYQFLPKSPFANTYQDYDRAGGFRIFYTAGTGAHAVAGVILGAWTQALGAATTDEYAYGTDGSRANDFQHGRIVWSPKTGVKVTLF